MRGFILFYRVEQFGFVCPLNEADNTVLPSSIRLFNILKGFGVWEKDLPLFWRGENISEEGRIASNPWLLSLTDKGTVALTQANGGRDEPIRTVFSLCSLNTTLGRPQGAQGDSPASSVVRILILQVQGERVFFFCSDLADFLWRLVACEVWPMWSVCIFLSSIRQTEEMR